MDSTDLLGTGLLVAGLLVVMNVVLLLRTWPERIFWSVALCLAALWGIHQADFRSVKIACWSVVGLAMLVSLALQYIRQRRDIARSASKPVPNPFILREIVRGIAFWAWRLGLFAGVAAFWIGALMLGESLDLARQNYRHILILLGLYALPLWLVPACVAVFCATYFSIVERWVAWLPLLIAGIFYTAVSGLAAADEVSALRMEAEKRVGISVFIPSTRQLPDHQRPGVTFEPLSVVESRGGDAQDVVLYLRAYIDEFSKYPRSFLRKVNVEWVAFVKGLRVGQEPRAATFLRFYAPTTMAPRGGMVYDVQQGATNHAYVRRALHHEFFHFIDYGVQIGGNEDADWLAMNPPGFKYTGEKAYFSHRLDHPAPGIITGYSAKSSWEDRAELFAALMDEETYPRLREIAAADPVVRRKIKYLIRFLERIDPAMGSSYFRKRLGEYWQPLTSP